MKLHLTREEFLALWRTHRGYTPSVCGDACVQRSDGMDLDSILMAEMEEWYRKLLLEADESLLAPEDIAADTAMPAPSGGSVTIHLPPGVLRVLCVRLSGWSRPACIVTDPDSPTAVSQLHPYTRACADSPVAVLHTDVRFRSILLLRATGFPPWYVQSVAMAYTHLTGLPLRGLLGAEKI